jgi:hypothetical protein
MARFLKWVAAILVGLFLALMAAVAVLGIFRFGMMPMMARGFRGPFLYGGFPYAPWAFLIGRLLFPLALIALLILGGIAIGRGLSRPRTSAVVTSCKNCGKLVQADWNNCPYCGTNLKNDESAVTQGENIS